MKLNKLKPDLKCPIASKNIKPFIIEAAI